MKPKNSPFQKLKENLDKSNQEAALNQIICFRNPKDSKHLKSLKKMGLEIDNILNFQMNESRVIKLAKYNQENQELTLSFSNGKTILYKEVPSHIVEDFIDAKSAGIFFYENIEKKYQSEELKSI